MKNFVTLLVLISLLFTGNSYAQGPRGPQDRGMFERFKAEKISYITEQLELSPEEAQQFWPLYNAYEKKRMDINIERRKQERYYKENAKTMKEKECIDILHDMYNLALQEVELNKTYTEEFLKVLPAKKVITLHHVEQKFRTRMLQRYKERRENQMKRQF